MTMLMMCLTLHPEAQEKVYQEIRGVVEEGGPDNLDYDDLSKLTYLEQALHETLRYYPTVILDRVCTKEYKVPDTDFVIPKGMPVQIPSSSIMGDEK